MYSQWFLMQYDNRSDTANSKIRLIHISDKPPLLDSQKVQTIVSFSAGVDFSKTLNYFWFIKSLSRTNLFSLLIGMIKDGSKHECILNNKKIYDDHVWATQSDYQN